MKLFARSRPKKTRLWLSVLALAALAYLALLPGAASASGTAAPTHVNIGLRSPLSAGAIQSLTQRTGGPAVVHSPIDVQQNQIHNVEASGNGPKTVDETTITSNPVNSRQLLSGGIDSNCDPELYPGLGFYASGDGGNTWNHTCMPTLPGHIPSADPIIAYDLNGTAYAGGIAFSSNPHPFRPPWVIAIMTSMNNGQTWSAPRVAVPPYFTNGLTDGPWMTIDNSTSSPYKGQIYISVTQFGPTQEVISVSRSTDGGQSFTTVAVSTPQPGTVDQSSRLTVGADGTVYLTWMRCTYPTGVCAGNPATMLFSKSTDGGQTWTNPTPIATVTLAPNSCKCSFYGNLPNTRARVVDPPTLAVDNSGGPHAGSLYSVMYNWTGSFMQVQVVESTDGGATWSQPVFPAPPSDTHDQFMPSISVSGTGTVGVTWMDRRNDPKNVQYEAFEALSSDGGISYGTNQQLATEPSMPTNFIGDFTGNTWANNVLYASWTDRRIPFGVSVDEVGWLT
jgi:hypothetical protein